MVRPKFFIVISAAIFLLERILQTIVSWPVLIFPLFAILFMMANRDESAAVSYILPAAVFFDFFSGFRFGAFSIAILAVCASVYLCKKYFNIHAGSALLSIVFSLVFVSEFAALLFFASLARPSPYGMGAVLLETSILSLPILVLIKTGQHFNDFR